MKSPKSKSSAERIVQAAIRKLAKQGYARTSLLDIAKEAEMSKGALHYHFPTKESLIQTVLTTACDSIQHRTVEAWEHAQSPGEAVRAALQALWQVRYEKGDAVMVVADLVAQSLYEPGLRLIVADYFQRATMQVSEHILTHTEALKLRTKIEPHMLARILNATLDGLMMQYFIDPSAFSSEQVIEGAELWVASMFEIHSPTS